MRVLAVLIRILVAALACGVVSFAGARPPPPGRSILFVVFDDMGRDKLAVYGAERPAPTPTLDALAAQGVVFDRFWSGPTCSPTRSQIQTGRYGYRYRIGRPIPVGHTYGLPTAERTIAEHLAPIGYTCAVIGKWHVSDGDGYPAGPLDHGYQVYIGTPQNLGDYYVWPRIENGQVATCTVYATTQQTDDAIAFVQSTSGPWLCWLAYNAPHVPYHWPPAEMHSYHGGEYDKHDQCNAMLEAADAELARVLAVLPPDTVVVVIGDNGSQGSSVVAPWEPSRSKNTVYQNGIECPLIVRWPGVPPGRTSAPVCAVDLFALMLDAAGLDLAADEARPVDAVSPFACLGGAGNGREWAFTEAFEPNGVPFEQLTRHDWAVTDGRWKLVSVGGVLAGYDLDTDPLELVDVSGDAGFPLGALLGAGAHQHE